MTLTDDQIKQIMCMVPVFGDDPDYAHWIRMGRAVESVAVRIAQSNGRGINHHTEAIDQLDACVFSGDLLEDEAVRCSLNAHCERWLRAIKNHGSTTQTTTPNIRTVSLEDGKYEFDRNDSSLLVDARRNGEHWPVGMDLAYVKVFHAALNRIEQLEKAEADLNVRLDAINASLGEIVKRLSP